MYVMNSSILYYVINKIIIIFQDLKKNKSVTVTSKTNLHLKIKQFHNEYKINILK